MLSQEELSPWKSIILEFLSQYRPRLSDVEAAAIDGPLTAIRTGSETDATRQKTGPWWAYDPIF